MLLYSVSLELVLKARALFEERDSIINGTITTFKDFLNRWQGSQTGHDFFKIIEHYKIEIDFQDREMLNNFREYTGWAGRYPYPKDDLRVLEMEKEGRNHGSVGIRHKNWIHDFIERQTKIMKSI